MIAYLLGYIAALVAAILLALILTTTCLLVLAAGIYGTPDWSWPL